MNKSLLTIYKIYNIERCYNLNKIKNNLKTIVETLKNLKCKINTNKVLCILENDTIDDISQYIIYKLLKDYNFNKINTHQNNKYIINIEIQTLKTEYYFKKKLNFNSIIYLRIIEVLNNDFHFLFILHPVDNIPIGIRKNNELETTLFQFQFFGRKLEDCINNKLNIMLNEHEIAALFLNANTNYITFPTIYFVYEARNHILTKLTNISSDDYLKEMVKYVRHKGYVVNIHRQNNQFVMGLVH
jgi:hypothetical protein